MQAQISADMDCDDGWITENWSFTDCRAGAFLANLDSLLLEHIEGRRRDSGNHVDCIRVFGFEVDGGIRNRLSGGKNTPLRQLRHFCQAAIRHFQFTVIKLKFSSNLNWKVFWIEFCNVPNHTFSIQRVLKEFVWRVSERG